MKKKPLILLFVFVFVILGAIAYGNSLHGKFVWDDEKLIRDNPYILHWSSLGKIFSQNILGGVGDKSHFYRPLQIATYTLDHSLWRFNVAGYHLTNIFLHILVAWVFFRLLAILFADEALAFIAGIFFIVHPLHVEAVSYISGRSDILSALFLTLTLIFYIKQARPTGRKYYFFMLASYAAALFSREQGLVLPVLLVAYHGIFKKKIDIKNFASLLGIALAYLFCRFLVLKDTAPDLATTTAWERLPGFFAAFASYLKLFFFPVPLHMEYGERLFSLKDPWVITGFLLIALFIVLMLKIKDRRRIALFSLSWFLLTLLPVSNIYPVGAFMAEHWMYLPSMGLFLLLAWGIRTLYGRRDTRIISIVFTGGLLVFFTYLTIRQNGYWSEPAAFYERTLKFAPDSSRVLNNLGNSRQDSGRIDEAIAFYERAISVKPNYAQALNNLGSAYGHLKEFDKAIIYYQKALKVKPEYADAYYNLGNAYQGEGRSGQAVGFYEKAVALRPDNTDYYYNLGNAYRNIGKTDDAISSYKKVLELQPDLSDAANNLGLAYIEAGKRDEARVLFENLTKSSPGYSKAYTNLAILYYQDKQIERARQYCRKAVDLGDNVDPGFMKLLYE